MKTYPIMLDVRGRVCVVVGAGAVGMRKVRSLLRAEAKVRLVAAEPPGQIDPQAVELIVGRYCKSHLAGAMLVFACTDDRTVNARIAADARSLGALVNAADQPADCDFHAPATIAEGDVVVAVGTGGACPGLAAALKDRLAQALPARVGEFAAALSAVRREVHALTAEPALRQRVMRNLASPAGYNAFAESGCPGLMRLARAQLEKG